MKISFENLKPEKYYENTLQEVTYLQIDFTSRCNANCLSCSGIPVRGDKIDIPFNKACEILDACLGQMNLKKIFVSCQAEFTVYEHCIDIIDYIEDNFKGVVIYEDTNCVKIPEYFIDRLNTLKNNRFNLSISNWAGNKEDYIKYHGYDYFDKVMSNINTYFDSLHSENVTLGFSSIFINKEQHENTLNNLENIIKSKNKKVNYITNLNDTESYRHNTCKDIVYILKRPSYIFRKIGEGEDVSNLEGELYTKKVTDISTGELITIREELLMKDFNGNVISMLPTKGNCDILNDAIYIKPGGEVACCMMLNNSPEYSLGNIYDQKVDYNWLKSIYNSDKRREQLQRNATSSVSDLCEHCISRRCFLKY